MTNRTCIRCGWVHFGVSRAEALDSISRFMEYYGTLSISQRESFYKSNPPSIADYEHCMVCVNSYKNFRPYKKGDCPDGCTLSPILKSRSKYVGKN